MPGWRRIRRGVHALLNRRRTDADIADEVRQYVADATATHEALGLPADRARRAALLEVGNSTGMREQMRSAGWEHGVETLMLDVRYALRRLRHSPAFTVTALVVLAIGIGASTSVFSAVSPILIEPLPFPGANRLVTIADRGPRGNPFPATLGTYAEVRARSRSFDAMAAADNWQPSLTGSGEPEHLRGERVTAGYFGLFGLHPQFGRGFDASDDQPGDANVVILGDAIFQRRFGGDRSIVGRTIQLDGAAYLVIGVLPNAFDNVVDPAAELWAPMQERVTGDFNTREWGHHYQVVGRLAPAVTPDAAMRELRRIADTPLAGFPRPSWADLDQGLLVQRLQDAVTGDVRPVLLAIAGAVLLLLGMAALNVANLVFTRGTQRRAEFAMRLALGAGRGRLVRQQLTESLVLAAGGGALSLVVAQLGVRALVALSPPGLPRVDAIRLDGHVFLFAAMLTLCIGVVVGVAPAAGASRTDLRGAIGHGVRGTTGGRDRVCNALVVAEVALALVLLVGAGLLVRSVRHLLAVAPGFDPAHVVAMQVAETDQHSATATRQFFLSALDAVRRVPGVTAAAFTSQLPLSGDNDAYGYEWGSFPSSTPGGSGAAFRYAVTPGYFEAMRIPLVRGRLLDAGDRPGAPEAIVINESFARRVFGDRDPIGQRVQFGPEISSQHPWGTVVGVVGDVKQRSLALAAPDAFYVAAGQWGWVDNTPSLVVRARSDAAALVPSLKRAIWSVDADEPIQRVATMNAVINATAGQRRFAMLAIEAFALAALALAAVGLYGAVAGRVAERTREIGIRTALGATPRDVVRRVVGHSLALTGLGGLVGIGSAVAATRLLDALLFGTSRVDPLTYGGVVALLIAVALVASWAPAHRAAGVDPTIPLRSE